MSSPFQIFRKHQKILLVVLIGLSMLSFVILGTIQDIGELSNMPPMLQVLTLALLIGAVAWVFGINKQKASEYGSIGLIAGAALGLVIMLQARRTDTVTLGEFQLTQDEMIALSNSRRIANSFVAMAVEKTNSDLSDVEQNMLVRQNQFTFGYPDDQFDQDVILGELLRREGGKIGMSLPDSAVHAFIKQATNDKMSREVFREIRTELRASESDVVDSIRQELFAREAALTLYSRIDLPPAVDWEFSKRLQIRQTATTAGVPISAFIDEKAEPPAAELQDLFSQFSKNYPGVTPDGKVKEGLPGFFQPPRVKMAYVTPDYQAFEQQVSGDVTEQEIEDRYQKDYVEAAKSLGDGPAFPEFPTIPGLDGPALPPPARKPAADPVLPETSTPPATDAGDAPPATAPPAPVTPPATETPGPALPPATETKPETEEPADNGCDDAPADQPAKPAADSTPAAPPAEASATTAPDAEAPAATTAVPAKPTAPAGDATPQPDPQEPLFPDTPEPAPPLPSATVRPLDDSLQAEIRELLVAEKTNVAIEQAMSEAIEKIRNEIGRSVHAPEGSPNVLTAEAATKQVQEYAAANKFRYVESDLLSYEEFLKSDDVPVAQFRLQTSNFMQQPTVADELFSTSPQDTFQPRQATDRDRTGKVIDRAIYWKLGHEKSYEPTSMDDERVRKAVVKTWRELNARKLAESRAKELVEIVRQSDKPMLETLADVTVDGQPNSTLLSIIQTGQFSWMRQTIVPAMTMQGFDFAPVRSTVPGVEQAGDDFMRIVFEELQAGDVGVAPNADRTIYYVTKIDTRIPGSDEEWTTVRNNFLSDRYDPLVDRLGAEMMSREVPHWAGELFRKYDVQLPEPGEGAE